MSTQLDTREDVVTGLSTIEGVDLDLEVKCDDRNEADRPEHPAHIITEFRCACGRHLRRPRCWTSFHSHLLNGTRCMACRAVQYDALVIVERLR